MPITGGGARSEAPVSSHTTTNVWSGSVLAHAHGTTVVSPSSAAGPEVVVGHGEDHAGVGGIEAPPDLGLVVAPVNPLVADDVFLGTVDGTARLSSARWSSPKRIP